MRLKQLKVAPAAFLILACLFYLAEAGIQVESEGEKAKYGLKPGDYALPPGAIELKIEKTFPTNEDENNGIYLAQPLGFCAAPSGSLFISDIRNSEIYVFDLAGKHLQTIGRFGQGPGEFMMPKELALLDDKVFVRDMGNKRLQILDKLGKYEGGFRLFRDYYSLVVSDGYIYAVPVFYVPPLENKDRCLIEALDLQGRVTRSFGGVLDVNPYDSMVLNKARLAFGKKNELWISFDCFPIVRKYSLNGELLAEYRYSYGIVDKKESFNKKMMAQRTKFAQVPYYFINSAICVTAEGLYLLGTSDKRLDILLMSPDGRILEFYWFALDRAFWCNGLLVVKEKSGKKFYVLESISARIEVLSRKY
jgi:hypothetical protein